MKLTLVFFAVFYIGTILSIVLSDVVRRVLVERKLRELLPDATSIKRSPPFFHIDPESVPKSFRGKEFLTYQKKMSKIVIIIMIIAILILALSPMIVKPLLKSL